MSCVLAVGTGTKHRLSDVDIPKLSTTRLTGIVEYEPDEFTFTARTEGGIKTLSAGTPEHRAVAAALTDACRRAARLDGEDRALRQFASGHGSVPTLRVRELPEDVHDMAGVRRVSRELFESAGAASA